MGVGKAMDKNKHFWENTGGKGELRNIEQTGKVLKRLQLSMETAQCANCSNQG